MSRRFNKNSREGFIIVISLTLMLVMTTMGVGLYYSSKQSSEQIGMNIGKSDSLYSAEACIAEARLWLKQNSATDVPCKGKTPGKICDRVAITKMSEWAMSGESQIFKNRSESQSYSCSISLLGSIAFEGGEGVGFDIGETDSYGNIPVSTKYLYRIRSTGTINSNTSTVEVIDSMIF